MVSFLKIVDKPVALADGCTWKFSFRKLYKIVGDNEYTTIVQI